MSSANDTKTELAVLRANSQFYRAFSAGDYPAMSELWAKQTPVVCFHPGMPALAGRQQVLESWQQILTGNPPFQMRCDHARAQIFGNTAIVIGYEANDDQPAHLAVTNLFVLEAGQWLMVHHHASPLARPIAKPEPSRQIN
jgi:ketosteroid isomerase-like protein